jgi:hypothetical protein
VRLSDACHAASERFKLHDKLIAANSTSYARRISCTNIALKPIAARRVDYSYTISMYDKPSSRSVKDL